MSRTSLGGRKIITLAVLSVPVMILLGYVFALDGAMKNIGSPDPDWDYMTAMAWWLVLLPAFMLLPSRISEKKAMAILWIVRLGVMLGFMLFYEANYGLDAYRYFHYGISHASDWTELSFGDGTRNMETLASLHSSVIPRSYHAMKVSAAAIGLLGVFVFYRAGCLLLDRRSVNLLYLLGLFPSVLFWGSILGKDPITLLGIALFVLGVTGFFRSRAIPHFLIATTGLLLAASIRIWLGMILLLPLTMFLVVGRRRTGRKLLLAVVAIPALIVSLNVFQEEFRVQTSIELVERTDQISVAWARGGSSQKIESFGSVPRMVAFLPVGAFAALFRPLPGEVLNPFGVLAGLENLALLIAMFYIARRGRWRRLRSPEGLWLIATVVVWSAVYGFVSYQNLGSAVRFKVQVMPIILLLIAIALEDRPASRESTTPVKPRSPERFSSAPFNAPSSGPALPTRSSKSLAGEMETEVRPTAMDRPASGRANGFRR